MSVKISTTGVKEIDAVLKGMPLVFQDRVLKTAHADAAKPMAEMARSLAPLGKTGNLKKSIGIERVRIKTAETFGAVIVRPRQRGEYKGQHGYNVEYGHFTRDGVNKTEPKPFLGPAFEMTKALVEGRIAESLGRKLHQFMKRTIKNG